MLGEGRQFIFSNPNLATFPGIAIFLTVLCFNLAGDGLRDALDPTQSRRRP
jgi:ABC-type dipeptide/oligopeptide/nickel transport system permease subunit